MDLNFSSPEQMYKKSSCLTPRVNIGVGNGVCKILKFYDKVFIAGEGIVKPGVLYVDGSCWDCFGWENPSYSRISKE